jgi:hypothetical protein
MFVTRRCPPIPSKGIIQQRESIVDGFAGPKGGFNAASPVRRMSYFHIDTPIQMIELSPSRLFAQIK